MRKSRRGLPRDHRRFTFGFGSPAVASPTKTLAMIGAASAQLGERALVVSGGSDLAVSPISSTSRW